MKAQATFALLLAAPQIVFSQAATQPDRHESLKQEIRLAYDRGLAFLKSKQNPETGQWGDAEPVAFTALAVTSLLLAPKRKPSRSRGPRSRPSSLYRAIRRRWRAMRAF